MKKLIAFWLAFILVLCSVCSVSASTKADANVPTVLGDADSDGYVSITDATSIQFHLASLTTLSAQALSVSDVDGDGYVSIMDSTTIQRFVAELIDKFPSQVETVVPSEFATGSGLQQGTTPTIQKPTEAETQAPTKPVDDGTPSEYEMEVLRLVNIERKKAGVEPVEFAYFIYDCAKLRAKECDLCFSHTRPDGNPWYTVFDEFKITNPWHYQGENIAWGHEDAQDVMYSEWGWMNSEGHRKNILKPEFKYMAVGSCECTEQPGTYATVQLFWG